MIYGYCRCSTNEDKQDIDRQIRDVMSLGVTDIKNIYKEYENGTKFDRLEFQKLLNIVKEGDTIISTEVSRLSVTSKLILSVLILKFSFSFSGMSLTKSSACFLLTGLAILISSSFGKTVIIAATWYGA